MPMEPLRRQRSPSSSPSFGSYSSETIAQIAARVIGELQSHFDSLELPNDADHERNDNDDFEFPFLSTDPPPSLVSADDIFRNGRIIPSCPLFGAVAVLPAPAPAETTAPPPPRRLNLRKLISETEGGEFGGGGDELAGLAEGTYCVWTPPCKKSSSLKRWRLRDLLRRSHNNGKKESMRWFLGSQRRSSGENGGAAAAKDGCRLRRSWFDFVGNGNGSGRKSKPI